MIRALVLSALFLGSSTEEHRFDVPLRHHVFDAAYEGEHPQGWKAEILIPKTRDHIDTVTLEIEQSSTGMWAYESMDPLPSEARIRRWFDLLEVSSEGKILAVLCIVRLPESCVVGGWDGMFDFGGSSGYTDPWDWEQEYAEVVITDPSVVALFMGTGDLVLSLRGRSDFYFTTDSSFCIYGAHLRTGLRGKVEYE